MYLKFKQLEIKCESKKTKNNYCKKTKCFFYFYQNKLQKRKKHERIENLTLHSEI